MFKFDGIETEPEIAIEALRTTSIAAAAHVEVRPGKLSKVKTLLKNSRGDDTWWWLKDALVVVVDHNGYLTFTSRVIPVLRSKDTKRHVEYELQREHPSTVIECYSNLAWNFVLENGSSSFAVVLGKKGRDSSETFSSVVDPNSTLLMLVELGPGPEVFRNIGYAWGDKIVDVLWKTQEIRIGGSSSKYINAA